MNGGATGGSRDGGGGSGEGAPPSDVSPDLAELQRRIADDADDFEAREALAGLLIELGDARAGVAQLYTAAERLGNRGAYVRAIGLLHRLLEVEPEHEHAQRLLARFYQRVPRQPTAGQADEPSGVEEDALGGRLFRLPEASALALSQILPFGEEDPPPLAGPIAIDVPPGPAEGPRPLLASLDRELRGSHVTGPHTAVSQGPPRRLELGGGTAEEDVAESPPAGLFRRISPASQALAVDRLPPSPILDLLERRPLERLLGMTDLLVYPPQSVAFDASTRTRALYVLVHGQLEVRREIEGAGMAGIDYLVPGDFFGEFELLTLTRAPAQVLAVRPSEVLELPEHILAAIAERKPEAVDLLWDAYFRRSFHSVMATAPLFSGLSIDLIRRVASEIEPLVFEVGDLVLREGELPRGLYGVVGGGLAVVRPSQTPVGVVTRLVPGDYFGLLSSSLRRPSRASVVATEATTLLWLPLANLEALRQAYPELDRALTEASQSRAWRYKLDPDSALPMPG